MWCDSPNREVGFYPSETVDAQNPVADELSDFLFKYTKKTDKANSMATALSLIRDDFFSLSTSSKLHTSLLHEM